METDAGRPLQRVKKILRDELHVEDIADDARQEDCAQWDSMTYMSIVARIRDEFGVEATPQNIQSFSSIEDILKEIEKIGKGG